MTRFLITVVLVLGVFPVDCLTGQFVQRRYYDIGNPDGVKEMFALGNRFSGPTKGEMRWFEETGELTLIFEAANKRGRFTHLFLKDPGLLDKDWRDQTPEEQDIRILFDELRVAKRETMAVTYYPDDETFALRYESGGRRIFLRITQENGRLAFLKHAPSL